MACTLLDPLGHKANKVGKEVLMDRHRENLKDTNIRFLALKPRLLKCTRPDRSEQNVLQMNSKGYAVAEALKLQPLSQLRSTNNGENIKP